MGKFKNISGQRFGSLTAVSRQPPLKDGRAVKWNCKCDCGNLVKVRGSDLTSGHTASCGCKQRRPNRTFTIAGKRFTLTELCRLYGQPVSTVEYRLNRGATIREALNKNRRYGVDTKLLELSNKLKALKEEKYEKEAALKELNGEIDGVISEMIQLMTDEELTNFSRNGTNFSLVVQEYPAPEPELKGELYERMKEQGYEHLFTINSQTLQATVKELISNNDGVLPDWLDGLIKIGEKSTIRLTKNKKYK